MIEEFWEEHCRWGMALPGVSCYRFEEGEEEETAEKLYNYFSERDPDALESDEYYVLIFEGEDTGIDGHNGENVAVWQKDIERVPVTEFFRRYEIAKEEKE